MAQYTGIQGQNILIVSSDPSDPTEGQIWYNTTTNLLKGYANVVTNSWASGGALNTARMYGNSGGAGIPGGQGLAWGGDDAGGSPSAALNQTNEWNGTYNATKTVTVS